MMKKEVCYILLIILLIILLVQSKFSEQHIVEKIQNDTVYVDKIIHDSVPKLLYKEIIRYDTIYVTINDSTEIPVELPIENKKYSNTIVQGNDTISYNASVSGFKPVLEDISFKVAYPLLKETKWLKEPKKRFTHGLQIGVGYGMFNKNIDVYLGYGFQFTF